MVSKRDLQREWCEPATDAFVDAVQTQPQPPCERFKCAKQHTCAVNGWACLAFVEYVSFGKVRRPYFRNPLEGPNSELFYERLEMRLLPRSQEKTAV